MSVGIDGQPTEETLAWWATKCAGDRAKAALVTGPKKIFNDAVLAVEGLAQILDALKDHAYDEFYRKRAKQKLSALDVIAKTLPAEEASLCEKIIEVARRQKDFEEAEDNLTTARSSILVGPTPDSTRYPASAAGIKWARGLDSASSVYNNLDSMFQGARVRIECENFYEHGRRQLESKALEL